MWKSSISSSNNNVRSDEIDTVKLAAVINRHNSILSLIAAIPISISGIWLSGRENLNSSNEIDAIGVHIGITTRCQYVELCHASWIQFVVQVMKYRYIVAFGLNYTHLWKSLKESSHVFG